MVFSNHETAYGGYPLYDYDPDAGLTNPESSIPHLAVGYGAQQTWAELFSHLLEQPDSDKLIGLSVGSWSPEMFEEGPGEMIELLVASAPQLPNLKVLFIGHTTYEEIEISWMHSGDLSPLWQAYPELEHFRTRGTNGLTLGQLEHEYLKELTIDSGGLASSVLEEVAAARLPALERLELMLGTDEYGWDGQPEDVLPFLDPAKFPRLKYLGLKNSQVADEIAELIGSHPAILKQLEVLDLSMGTLSARGGRALLGCEEIRSLKKLDLHHHYLTDETLRQFQELPIEVDLSEHEGHHDGNEGDSRYGRFVAVGE